jgi:hypothetical protein
MNHGNDGRAFEVGDDDALGGVEAKAQVVFDPEGIFGFRAARSETGEFFEIG